LADGHGVGLAPGLACAVDHRPASGQVALPPIVLCGVMPTMLTGFALELLLRNPKMEERTRGA